MIFRINYFYTNQLAIGGYLTDYFPRSDMDEADAEEFKHNTNFWRRLRDPIVRAVYDYFDYLIRALQNHRIYGNRTPESDVIYVMGGGFPSDSCYLESQLGIKVRR